MKYHVQKMTPEIDQNKDHMIEILEGKESYIYKWTRDNIWPELNVDKGPVSILMTSFSQYISGEISPSIDEMDSSAFLDKLVQEKQLLLSFRAVMQKSPPVRCTFTTAASKRL
ncbi:hypothetical protein A6R68_05140, partial [Neotoma lepida]